MIRHVALWTRDLPRVIAFWTATFSAQAGAIYESARRPGFRSCFLAFADGPTLEIMTGPWLRDENPDGDGRPGYAHVAIGLDSRAAVDALAERQQKVGGLVSPPRWTGDGFYEAVIRDPDGNLIEITA